MLTETEDRSVEMPVRAFCRLTRSEGIRISVGLAAFLIYAFASLLADQYPKDSSWPSYAIERAGIASAISNIVYGAPIATVYRNLFNAFEFSTAPVDQLIQQTQQKQIGLGELIPYVPDGIGMGQAVFTTVAARMFGINPQSVVLLFLILMGVTTLTFLTRFHDWARLRKELVKFL
jgi:hypothetical protein